MTRKRVGQGLLDAFSDVCECCNGRGVHVSLTPVELQPEPGASVGRRRKRKGEVEKTVEKKIAKHEAEKEEAEEASSEDRPVRADRKHAGRAKAGRSRAAKATVEAVDPAEPVETGAGNTTSDETVQVEAGTAEPAAGPEAALSPLPARSDDESGAPESTGTEGAPEAPEAPESEASEAPGRVETAQAPEGADQEAVAGDAREDAAAAGNGRRRRPRRTSRAKAEVGSEDGE
jgi:ribonuclease E